MVFWMLVVFCKWRVYFGNCWTDGWTDGLTGAWVVFGIVCDLHSRVEGVDFLLFVFSFSFALSSSLDTLLQLLLRLLLLREELLLQELVLELLRDDADLLLLQDADWDLLSNESDFLLRFGELGGLFDRLGGELMEFLWPRFSGTLLVVDDTWVLFGSSNDLKSLSSDWELLRDLFLSSDAWATRASKPVVGFADQAWLSAMSYK